MLDADAIKAIAALGSMERAQAIETADGGRAVVLADGYQLHKLPPLEQPLTRVKQHVVLHDRDSFIAYVNEFKRPISRIFAEPGFLSAHSKPVIKAVLDYHNPRGSHLSLPTDTTSESLIETAPQPEYATHIATYEPRYSDQWKRWTQACAEPLAQVEFAELIEECREDINNPLAAELLDIVRTFKASKKVSYDSVVYRRDGSVKLEYNDHVDKVGSSVNLPEQMTLGIPVYYRGTMFAVGLFIRFKVNSGVAFNLKMDRADRLEDEAFTELARAIAEATGVPLHIGRV